MSKKKAIKGFKRLSFFPITKNTRTEYEVGEAIPIENVQEMSKEDIKSEKEIYADDTIYLNLVNWSGQTVSITVAEMDLQKMATLGFGEYTEGTGEFKHNPQGSNKEFAVSFACEIASGEYRMFKFYDFVITEVKESAIKTKGDSGDIQPYTITGTFKRRAKDEEYSVIKDGSDLTWLDTIEAPATEEMTALNSKSKKQVESV